MGKSTLWSAALLFAALASGTARDAVAQDAQGPLPRLAPSAGERAGLRSRALDGDLRAAARLLATAEPAAPFVGDVEAALAALLGRRSWRAHGELVAPEDVARALCLVRPPRERLELYCGELSHWGIVDPRHQDSAAFARALLALERGSDEGREPLLALARGGHALAPQATWALFEHAADEYAEAQQRWLGEWSLLGEAAPTPPLAAALARMTELADLGEDRAVWWLFTSLAEADLGAEERNARRAALSERLFDRAVHAAWFVDVARAAPAVATNENRAVLLALLERATSTTRHPDVRPWCLHARAELLVASEPPDPEGAARLFDQLVVEHPEHDLSSSARGEAFALRHLRIGQPLPAATRPDVLGRTMDLSTRRGKVLVLVFLEFGAGDADLLSVLDQLALLHSKERFEVVAVAVDADVEAARERHARSGRDWEVSWQGSRGGPWPSAWGVRSFPTTFVVAADGTLRARDVTGATLTRAVLDLIGERVTSGG
jgi:hypothetical protein